MQPGTSVVLGSQSYLLTGEMNILLKASPRGGALSFGDSVCHLMKSPPFLLKHSTVQNGYWLDHGSQKTLGRIGRPFWLSKLERGRARARGAGGQAPQQRVCCSALLKLRSPDLGAPSSSRLGTGAWAVSLRGSRCGSHRGSRAARPLPLPATLPAAGASVRPFAAAALRRNSRENGRAGTTSVSATWRVR